MKMNPSTPQAVQLINEGLTALSRATQYGICIDTNYCKKVDRSLQKRIEVLSNKFYTSDIGRLWKTTYKTPNFDSEIQIKNILFNKLKLESIKKTKKQGISIDNEVLTHFSKKYPEIKTLIDLRKYKKVKDTYIAGYMKEQVNSIIHPNFSLHTTDTFRSSADSPSFQNIPKRDKKQSYLCRNAIIPRKGNQFIDADFKGIEVAIACCYHQDPTMLQYLLNPKSDMHADMAIQIFMLDNFTKKGFYKVLRNATKNGFVFPQFYGDYYGNNAVSLCNWVNLPTHGNFSKKDGILMNSITIGEHFINKGIKNFEAFKNHMEEIEDDFWGNRFKVYKKWKENWIKSYVKKGYMWTKTGFTCQGVLRNNQIINFGVQGSAFHCLLKCFIEVDKRLMKEKMKSRLIGQIHDAMIGDVVPEEKDDYLEIVRYVTCEYLKKEWSWINVPLEIEVDIFPVNGSWASESKSIKLN